MKKFVLLLILFGSAGSCFGCKLLGSNPWYYSEEKANLIVTSIVEGEVIEISPSTDSYSNVKLKVMKRIKGKSDDFIILKRISIQDSKLAMLTKDCATIYPFKVGKHYRILVDMWNPYSFKEI